MRLIDADALKRLVDEEWFDCPSKESFFDEIGRTPTIDPVKRGKWIYDKGLYRCTACNNLLTVAGWDIHEEQIYKAFKFCPNCGARME